MSTLHSALEDLQNTTLKAVPGSLRRLEYLARLRTKKGIYVHWGLSRTYGDMAANKALVAAHKSLLSQILSTPLQKLLQEVEESSQSDGVSPGAYVQRLSTAGLNLLPSEPAAGSETHLNSVLHALSSLVEHRAKAATPPASWPHQPPAR